jgi:cytochrome P450
MSRPDFYFNPFDQDFRANPYPHFPALLDGPPRQLNLFMPATLIARYADVVTVLHDHERFTVRRPEIPFRERIDPFGGAPTILTADPPVHTRLRRLVSKAFTPRRGANSSREFGRSRATCSVAQRTRPKSKRWPRSPIRCR